MMGPPYPRVRSAAPTPEGGVHSKSEGASLSVSLPCSRRNLSMPHMHTLRSCEASHPRSSCSQPLVVVMHSADFRDRDHRACAGWQPRGEGLGKSEPVTRVGAIDGAAGRHEGGCAEEVQILQKVSGNNAPQQ